MKFEIYFTKTFHFTNTSSNVILRCKTKNLTLVHCICQLHQNIYQISLKIDSKVISDFNAKEYPQDSKDSERNDSFSFFVRKSSQTFLGKPLPL